MFAICVDTDICTSRLIAMVGGLRKDAKPNKIRADGEKVRVKVGESGVVEFEAIRKQKEEDLLVKA